MKTKKNATNTNTQWISNLIVPLLAIIFAMIVGAIFMLAIGADPLKAYQVLFKGSFGNARNLFETLVNTIPLIFTGLAVAFAFQCGLFNVGGEGQFLVGYLAAAWIGGFFQLPWFIHIPLALLAAITAGALWGGIPGLLKAKLGVHEVISTIMLNYIAFNLINLLIRTVLRAPGTLPATPRMAESARFLRFSQISWLKTIFRGSRLNISIFLALLVAWLIWWLLWKTNVGYEIRAVGFNPFAAEYGGISVAKNTILALAISGALAGLAGASQSMGLEFRAYQPFGFIGYGMTGIAVALLGKNHPVGVILAALLFGTLQRGANTMQMNAGVPREVIFIIQAIIIFFAASDYVIRKIYRRIKTREKEVA